MMNNELKFGPKLKELRLKRGLSLHKLAHITHLSFTGLNSMERGLTNYIRHDTLLKIITTLRTTEEEDKELAKLVEGKIIYK